MTRYYKMIRNHHLHIHFFSYIILNAQKTEVFMRLPFIPWELTPKSHSIVSIKPFLQFD